MTRLFRIWNIQVRLHLIIKWENCFQFINCSRSINWIRYKFCGAEPAACHQFYPPQHLYDLPPSEDFDFQPGPPQLRQVGAAFIFYIYIFRSTKKCVAHYKADVTGGVWVRRPLVSLQSPAARLSLSKYTSPAAAAQSGQQQRARLQQLTVHRTDLKQQRSQHKFQQRH